MLTARVLVCVTQRPGTTTVVHDLRPLARVQAQMVLPLQHGDTIRYEGDREHAPF